MSRDELVDNLGTIARSGTQRLPEQLCGEQRPGRQADRPVRRRLLLGLHGRRPRSWCSLAQGRRGARLALALRRPQRLHGRGDGRARAARHRGDPAAARRRQGVPGRVPPAPDRAQLFRPHRRADPPRAAAKAGDAKTDRRASRSRSTRRARSGRGRRPRSPTSSTRSSTTTSRTPSTSRGRACTSRPRAWCPTRRCCSCRARRRSTCTTRKRQHGVKLYVRRVFITGDLEGADAALSALRQRRGRFRGPAAQRLRETLQHSAGARQDPASDLVKRLLDELATAAPRPRRRAETTRNSGSSSARC